MEAKEIDTDTIYNVRLSLTAIDGMTSEQVADVFYKAFMSKEPITLEIALGRSSNLILSFKNDIESENKVN